MRIVWATIALGLWTAIAGGQTAPSTAPVEITLHADAPGYRIADQYSGLSYEMQRVLPDADGTYYFRADNGPLVAMFRTLGIRSLRIGGNTADRATIRFPGDKDLDNLFAFAKAAGVKVIFTMRLSGGDPGASAAVAKYIMGRYASEVAGFAIGNEPNIFTHQYREYVTAFTRYSDAILAAVPGARFCGPGSVGTAMNWAGEFAGEFPKAGRLAFVTCHYYPGDNAAKIPDPADLRRKMLSRQWPDEDYRKTADSFVPAVLAKGFSYRLEEVNSAWNGGRKDASDTQASALWGLDFLYWWASHGCDGLNFHTGDFVARLASDRRCDYAAFWSTAHGYDAHPLAYGIKAFDLGGHGRLIPAEIGSNPQNLNLTAYGVLANDGSVFATVINKEYGAAARTGRITLGIGRGHAGKVMFLTAPDNDVAAKSGITIGGDAIHEDGSWQGRWTPLSASIGFAFDLPAASAAVVELSPN